MSLDIPSGIILLWPGANGSIPSGFSRENDLNDKFPVGAASGAGAGSTGGGNSHSHGTTHNHGAANHTHGLTTPPMLATPRRNRTHAVGNESTNLLGNSAHQNHTHNWTSNPGHSLANNFTTQNWSGGGAFGSGGADPSYYNMIFIESDGTPETYPTNCVVMRNDATGVSGWTQHSGSKSRYIQGAGSGGNGGGTGGGSHTHSLGSHGHSYPNHYHASPEDTANASAESPQHSITNNALGRSSYENHYHKFRIRRSVSGYPQEGGTSSGSAPAANSSSTTQAPVYRYMWGLEKTSASAKEDEGMIVLWNGTIGNIPEDWLLCDGSNGTPDLRDKFLRMANSSGEVGGTGGGNSHSHSGSSHSHSAAPGHAHIIDGTGPTPDTNWPPNSGEWPVMSSGDTTGGQPGNDTPGSAYQALYGTRPPHTHSTQAGYYAPRWNSDNTTGGQTVPSTNASVDSVDARPPYRTVVYLFSPEGEEAGGNIGMFGSNF